MSAKRVASTSIDWASFAARVPKSQVPQFQNFKAKCDGYLRHVVSKPENLPKINWEQYQSRVAVVGMVEDFKKQYEGLKIPYPEDKYTTKLNGMEKLAMEDVAKFCSESELKIAQHNAELKHWHEMIPFSEMTMEELAENCPDMAINLDKPTFWPHTPEVQPGYVAADGSEEEEHH